MGQIKWQTTQQGVSQTESHHQPPNAATPIINCESRGGAAITASMSDLGAIIGGVYTDAEIRCALSEGRRAELQAPNPYYGCGELAVAWRRGYRQALTSRVQQTRQMVAYYRVRAHLN
ncbi:MAG: hypothetical protein KIH64_015515 [Mycobacterium sp.]|nr:hypothetical protein [Mycobacterium sp.]